MPATSLPTPAQPTKPQPTKPQHPALRGTLLTISSLTIMAAATISPGLPRMQAHFADVPEAGLLVRLVLTVVALSVALFSPISGIIADRIGRKPLLMFGLLLYALAGTSGLYLETLPALLAGRVLLGIAVSAITTTSSALVADYFTGPVRQRFIGLQSAFVSFGGVLFQPLGGALADFGWHAPFAIYFASLAIVPFAWLALTEPERSRTDRQASKHPIPQMVWSLYALAFIYMIVFYLLPTQLPFFVQNVIGLKPSASGYIVALYMLSSATTALQYPRLRAKLNEPALMVLGFGLLGAGWALLGAARELNLILIGMVISGAAA